MPGERTDAFSRLEQELHQERAAALGRIGRTLELLIERLETLRLAAERSSSPERSRLSAEHAETRARAIRWRWYLDVQRESVGLRRHERLDEMYSVPPPLSPSA